MLHTGREVDSRNGNSLEVIGYSAKLLDLDRTLLMNSRRRLSPYYAAAETLWYLSGESDASMILAYAPSYARFLDEDGTAFGAYGGRLRANLDEGLSQLHYVHDVLRSQRNSRQAVCTLWQASDLVHAVEGDKRDLPCTLSWQFLLRDNKLHMVVTMRSNDAWLGFPYDVFAFTTIQRLIANSLGATCGTYTHNVGSMHLYEKDFQAAEESVRAYGGPDCYAHGWDAQDKSNLNDAKQAVLLEHHIRTTELPLQPYICNLGQPMRDLVVTCAHKWHRVDAERIHSPLFRELIDVDRRRRRPSGQDDAVQEAS